MATKEELQKVLNIIQTTNWVKKLDLAHEQWDLHQLKKIAEALPDNTKLKKIIFAIPDSIDKIKAINNIFKGKNIKCAFIVPAQAYELEQSLSSKMNEKYKQKYFCGLTQEGVATVKQLDKGFTIYEETKLAKPHESLSFNREFGDTKIYYANKQMEATPLGQNIPAEILKTLENVNQESDINQENRSSSNKRVKKANKEATSYNENNLAEGAKRVNRKNRGAQLYRKIKKNTIELWKKAFGGTSSLSKENSDEAVVINRQGLALQVNLSAEVSTYNSISRGELYLPIGIKDVENNQPICGGFVALREYGTKEQLKSVSEPEPIEVVHAVNCMFGAEFYGIDEQGVSHPLTIPGYELPSGRTIVKIVGKNANKPSNSSKPYYTSEDLHPDEILSRQMLQNFIAPLAKVICNKDVRKLSYHAPLANYTIYGINRYLKGQMTFPALVEYIDCVRARAEEHRSFLESYANEHGFELDLFSTMDKLGLADGDSGLVLKNLLDKLGLDESHLLNTKDEGENLIELLYEKIVEYISNQADEIGEAWRAVKNKVPFGKERLHGLNYIDYAAAIAVSKIRHGMIFPIFPGNEAEILERYGDLFAEKFGKIPTLSFLPPFQVHINEDKNTVFYLEKNTEQVVKLLKSDLPRVSGLQTYALAWNDLEVAQKAAEMANQILSEHEAYELHPDANTKPTKINNLRNSSETLNKKELLSSRNTHYNIFDQINKDISGYHQVPTENQVSSLDFN